MVEVNKRKPVISVIMPVYNSEEYLHIAVESVLRQTMGEWELIMIDDGSSDQSPELCDSYAEKDARIRVFHQENQGITKTRNRGIREAKGEYLTFIDNDDEYTDDILEKCCRAAKEHEADIVKFGYRVEEDYPNGIKDIRNNKAVKQILLDRSNLAKEYKAVRDSGYFNMIWNGIYRKTLFEDETLMFDEAVIMGYEDWIFNNNMYLIPERQVVLDEIGYIHYQRFSHSTSKKFHPNQIEADVKAAEAEYRLTRKLNEDYGCDIPWIPRASDYLIDILSIFERQGCTYGIKKQVKVVSWVRSKKVFYPLVSGSGTSGLPVQRRMLVKLFEKEHDLLLLLLAKLYFKYILWKKKRKTKEREESHG